MEYINKDETMADIDSKSATALWILMVGHVRNVRKSSGSKRLVVTVYFYICHTLAVAINKFTDGEVLMLGTVKLNLIDAVKKHNVVKALDMLKDASRGTWYLVAAYDRHPDFEKGKKSMLLSNVRSARQHYQQLFPTCKVKVPPPHLLLSILQEKKRRK